MKVDLTERTIRHIICAMELAAQSEEALADSFTNTHSGKVKHAKVIAEALKNAKSYRKIGRKFEKYHNQL